MGARQSSLCLTTQVQGGHTEKGRPLTSPLSVTVSSVSDSQQCIGIQKSRKDIEEGVM